MPARAKWRRAVLVVVRCRHVRAAVESMDGWFFGVSHQAGRPVAMGVIAVARRHGTASSGCAIRRRLRHLRAIVRRAAAACGADRSALALPVRAAFATRSARVGEYCACAQACRRRTVEAFKHAQRCRLLTS